MQGDLYQNYNNRQETGCAMKPLSSLPMLVFTALTLLSAPSLALQDEGRPRLEHFASYDEFLKAMVTWEARQTSAPPAATAPAAAQPVAKAPSTRPIPVPEGVDPTSETAPPPLAITGPEDLEVAVELAKDITHPDYTAPIRYNRSTHISFPLPSIDGSDMSQASISGGLQPEASKIDDTALLVPGKEPNPLDETATAPAGAPVPASYAGMSLRPENGPSHVTVGTMH